ncbi:YegP family protein [Arthrobacter sp. KN11-1C]|uniref:YegP family protein n=1 Tax=Arthrobacter sp. KN11-1C TaxID=3445774 RepID=UPI003FA16864
MAGMFELFLDAQSRFRFRLKASDGTVLAVSAGFADKPSAMAGIRAVRECAGTSLITDLSPQGPSRPPRSGGAGIARP